MSVSYRLDESVAVITMDDGKVNALGPAMLAEINKALDSAEADGAGAVVIAGNERVFSGGFDLKVFKSGDVAASIDMLKEHPEGVGAGNFQARIGDFTEEHAKRDAHNTFVLCWSELGIPGLVLFVLVIVNAFRTLMHLRKASVSVPKGDLEKLYLVSYGLMIGLVTFLVCGLTMSRLYAEGMWWFLVMPLCLSRALENQRSEALKARSPDDLGEKTVP